MSRIKIKVKVYEEIKKPLPQGFSDEDTIVEWIYKNGLGIPYFVTVI